MMVTKRMSVNVHTDVREKFLEVLGDFFHDVNSEQLIDYAVENVLETSGIMDEGIYNMADVNLAVQRSIAHHLFDKE